jgi:CRP/FNR family transcriptional regulator, cyclic AMP receptor protein
MVAAGPHPAAAGLPQRPAGARSSLGAMASTPKALDLKSIWLFSACTASEIRKIRSSLDEVLVPAGKVLVEEGTAGREFFLIVNGTAKVTRKGRQAATLGPGSYFGELSLLDRRPRSASVSSVTDLDVLVLDQRHFNALLDSVPTIARKLLAAMATRLREQDAKVDYA